MRVCPTCDGYGVIPNHLTGLAEKCPHPDCPGYVSHAQAMAELRGEKYG
jgi:hypothetical protein